MRIARRFARGRLRAKGFDDEARWILTRRRAPPLHRASNNPGTGTNATCDLYCAPDDGPCYCESLDGPPWQPVFHSHASHDLNASRSYYDPFVATPELTARLARPDYCPPADAPPQFGADTEGLEDSCNKAWF